MARILLKDEAISGKFLLLAALVAIAAVNSPWSGMFNAFWEHDFAIKLGDFTLSADFRRWINEGLMAIFFLVISLEIKREVVRGELRKWRAAALPIGAALGGIAVPIAIYMTINKGFDGFHGWGIPLTTDTAFAIGLLALLGRRIPTPLKVFLLTAMVVDDVAAIVAIAIFYTDHVNVLPLIVAAGIYTLILTLHWIRLLHMRTFIILGIGMWIAIYLADVHASITGVILGLVAPISVRHRANKPSIAERLEQSLIPLSTFVVIPLFALANAGVVLDWNVFNNDDAIRVGLGIILGLVAGKTIGIVGASWIITKLRIAHLPKGVGMNHIVGIGLLAGVGFTLSIFIADLAFTKAPLIDAAKMSIFAASVISAVGGLLYLSIVAKPVRRRR